MSEDELSEAIYVQTTLGPPIWDESTLEQLCERISLTDARNRGLYRNAAGDWFIARNGKFHPLSDRDPDSILHLALLGGIFGLHRFALGNWFTGTIYALTGGLMGLG